MQDEVRTTALFFAPFVSSSMRVEPDWIDYNGHLNIAYYHVLFDRAVDEVFSLVGLNRDYVDTRNASFFAAECHILYKRELTAKPDRGPARSIDRRARRSRGNSPRRRSAEKPRDRRSGAAPRA